MPTLITTPKFAALACIIVLGSAVAQSKPKIPPKYHASPDEVAQLPKYCYAQFVDGAYGGNATFSISSQSCGPAMNHFCGALVAMMRSQKQSVPRRERVGYIQNAVKEIDYTIHDMKPGCSITKDVLAAKERARVLSTIIK